MSIVVCQALLCMSCVAFILQYGSCAGIPTPVQLGSVIIAAVEAEAEKESRQEVAVPISNFLDFLSNLNDWDNLEKALIDIEEGRGKFRKKQKMLKYLYPLAVGVLVAKSVIIPLFLKFLTAISTSSFVMSKVALATTGFLALKWILGNAGKEHTHLEIVHLPQIKPFLGSNNGWDDMSWSGSSFIDTKTKQQPLQPSKYIPLSGGKDSLGGMNKIINSVNGYSYPYYNKDNYFDGKPFL